MRRSLTVSIIGLAVFIAVVVVAVAILLWDWHLAATGQPTITERVFDDWRGYALVGLVALAPVGLLIHFRTFARKR